MKKMILGFFLAFVIFFLMKSGYLDLLTFAELKQRQHQLLSFNHSYPFFMFLIYFCIYILVTAFSLPGATILTLGAGAIFGFFKGVLLVSFASSIGATSAFLLTRYFFRATVESKFSNQLKALNSGIEKEGAFYLFSLRLVPLFPFFLINMLMGLTNMPLLTFYVVSQLGMLVGTTLYVNAGTQLASLETIKGIISLPLLSSLILLGVTPLLAKKMIEFFKIRKIYRKFTKPESFDYNVLVIGAGAAGLVTSYIAAALRSKVALIEKDKMGGECLNTGCVPSKALIKVSKVMKTVQTVSKFGISDTFPQLKYSDIRERVQRVIKDISPHDSVERYTSLGVDCHVGEAEILSPWQIKVNDKILSTKNIVIASGSKPIIPLIPGLDKIHYITSETIWNLQELPERLLILGGGPVGCELGQALRRIGADVTIVSLQKALLPKEDDEISLELKRKFKSEGVKILLDSEVLEVGVRDGNKWMSLKHNGEIKEIEFDDLLIAQGRRANTDIPGIEKLELEIGDHGTFSHDQYLRTKFPNVYVCGDCAGPYQFSHMAAHQAWYASVNSLFSPFKLFKVDYSIVPSVTFTDPEVARVGLSEREALEKNINYEVIKYSLDDLDRAIADGENEGFIKVITQKGSDKILGVAIVSSRAGDLLGEFILAMKWGIGMNKILSTIHPYPTFSEAIKYTAGTWKRNHKPERLLQWVERFHHWRRN